MYMNESVDRPVLSGKWTYNALYAINRTEIRVKMKLFLLCANIFDCPRQGQLTGFLTAEVKPPMNITRLTCTLSCLVCASPSPIEFPRTFE